MNDSQQLKRGQVDALEVYCEQFRGIVLEPAHTMGAQAGLQKWMSSCSWPPCSHNILLWMGKR